MDLVASAIIGMISGTFILVLIITGIALRQIKKRINGE